MGTNEMMLLLQNIKELDLLMPPTLYWVDTFFLLDYMQLHTRKVDAETKTSWSAMHCITLPQFSTPSMGRWILDIWPSKYFMLPKTMLLWFDSFSSSQEIFGGNHPTFYLFRPSNRPASSLTRSVCLPPWPSRSWRPSKANWASPASPWRRGARWASRCWVWWPSGTRTSWAAVPPGSPRSWRRWRVWSPPRWGCFGGGHFKLATTLDP